MYAVLTFTKVLPENVDQFKTIFIQEFLPLVRKQKGFFNIFWLEPTDKVEDFILQMQWLSKEYADLFLTGNPYKEFLLRIKEFMIKEPVVKTYNFEKVIEEVPEMVK